MPMHDWSRVKAGIYHNFHVLWMSNITNRLNAGLLPDGYFAMAEQIIGQPEPDVVTLQTGRGTKSPFATNGGVQIAQVRPKTRFVLPIGANAGRYARKANRIVVHHDMGDVVAVIEIVSPGNKDRKRALEAFTSKAIDLLQQRVNLLIIDPFPPGKNDPNGIHAAISAEFTDEPFELPTGKPLTFAAYQAAPTVTAYVDTISVGDRLPDMPVFLDEDCGVELPLEDTYQATWSVLPSEVQRFIESADGH